MLYTSTIGSIADSAFSPKYISGLQLWFDAADSSTLYDNPTGSVLTLPSGTIGRWEDKSPNKWHATQSLAANSPRRITGSLYNGLDTVRFDGVSNMMYMSGALDIAKNVTEITYFVVSSAESKASNGNILFASTTAAVNTTRFTLQVTSNVGQIRPIYRRLDADAALTLPYNSSNSSGSAINCFCTGIKYDASSSYYYINGAEQTISSSAVLSSWSGSATNSSSLSVTIGASGNQANFHLGNIGEIIYYNKYLSNTERRAVERYLVRKWNIRSYDQKQFKSSDIFSNLELYVSANNLSSYPESGSVWYDLSGNNRTGSLLNGVVYDTTDGIKSLSLDGVNDYINFGRIFAYTSQSFSFSCWVCPLSSTGSGFHTYVSNYNGGNGYWNYSAFGSNDTGSGYDYFTMYRSNAAAQTQGFTNTNGSVYINKWHFATVTRDSSNLNIYVNGVYARQDRTAIINCDAGIEFFIGRLGDAAIYSKMRIGECLVHSRALSYQEVTELYNFTKKSYNIVD